MEKYARFATLTNRFLHGQLEKLEVDYDDDTSVTLKIFYKDTNEYRFDYEIQLDIPMHIVEYATHFANGRMDQTKIHREQAFEDAVCHELFQTTIM